MAFFREFAHAMSIRAVTVVGDNAETGIIIANFNVPIQAVKMLLTSRAFVVFSRALVSTLKDLQRVRREDELLERRWAQKQTNGLREWELQREVQRAGYRQPFCNCRRCRWVEPDDSDSHGSVLDTEYESDSS